MDVDSELRQFASSGAANSRRSVIIEPRTQPVAPPQRYAAAVKPAPAKKSEKPSDRDAFDAVVRALKALDLPSPVVELSVVGTLVAELTPEQLRHVMSLPSVAAVRENRTRRVTPRA